MKRIQRRSVVLFTLFLINNVSGQIEYRLIKVEEAREKDEVPWDSNIQGMDKMLRMLEPPEFDVLEEIEESPRFQEKRSYHSRKQYAEPSLWSGRLAFNKSPEFDNLDEITELPELRRIDISRWNDKYAYPDQLFPPQIWNIPASFHMPQGFSNSFEIIEAPQFQEYPSNYRDEIESPRPPLPKPFPAYSEPMIGRPPPINNLAINMMPSHSSYPSMFGVNELSEPVNKKYSDILKFTVETLINDNKTNVSFNDMSGVYSFKMSPRIINRDIGNNIVSFRTEWRASVMSFLQNSKNVDTSLIESLTFGGIPYNRLRTMFAEKTLLDEGLDERDKLYIREHFEINDNFRNLLESNIEQVSFVNNFEVIREEINNLVGNYTQNRITDLIRFELSRSTLEAFVNVIYFELKWAEKFEKSKSRTAFFTNQDSMRRNTCMMSINSTMNYTWSNILKSQIISLNYEGGKYGFLLIFPDPEVVMTDIYKQWESLVFDDLLNSLEPQELSLRLPRFRARVNLDTSSRGIRKIFTTTIMQLMNPHMNKSLSVNQIAKEAYIKIYEEGSTAAAASAIFIENEPQGSHKDYEEYPTGNPDYESERDKPPKRTHSITVDRPFFYVIYSKTTNTPIFVGNVGKANAEFCHLMSSNE